MLQLSTSIAALSVFGLGEAKAAPARVALEEIHREPDMPGVEYSAKARKLAGQRIRVEGFLAPHAGGRAAPFLVLASRPMGGGCPHCLGALDLPGDSLVAYFGSTLGLADTGIPVAIEGVLDLGSRTDVQTGFVSTVRLFDARVIR
ncbi:MAG: hypothetical protein FJX60_22055 [Alphaproteobacteria bacterium]|nr:hypothetical protein [Alphaproteobacteria bacterium]